MAGIEIKGLKEYQQMFKEVESKAPGRIEAKVNEVLEEVKKGAREKAPKGATGNLKKGFKVEKAKPIGNNYMGKVYNNAPHSHLIEDGHRIVRPKGNVLGWVEGTHMLENTTNMVDAKLKSDLQRWLPTVFKELDK